MFLAFLLFMVALAHTLPYNDVDFNDWEQFKDLYGKKYQDADEDWERMNVYLENVKKVENHNNLFHRGLISYELKINQFSDMRMDEKKITGFKGVEMKRDHVLRSTISEGAPSTVDWRTRGAVTPVVSQGQCGSAWAYSVTGAVESQNFLKTGKLVVLSEQNVVDCCTNRTGCDGGLMFDGYECLVRMGGIDTQQSYPDMHDGKCHFNKSTMGARVTGYVDLPQGDEDVLKMTLYKIGPVSAAIDASEFSFQLYAGGVYDEPECSTTQLDHGVLVVGYGTENGKDYWLVKNSWGASWGEQGYIKMSRNANNQCGIATQASYPLV